MANKALRINSWQSLRFFASLGVLQYHLWQNYLGVTLGHPGTDIFLVLVGYVAAYTQASSISLGNWRKYIQARYVRLYTTYIPLFLLVLIQKWDQVDLGYVLRSFFLIPQPEGDPLIGSSWMLTMFVLFYFIFSIAFLSKSEKILLPIFGIWIMGIVAVHLFRWKPALPVRWAELLFSFRNLEFILGYAGGVLVRKQILSEKLAKSILWLGLAGLVVGTVWLNRAEITIVKRAFIVGIPVTLLLCGVAVLELKRSPNLLVHLLTTPWLVWLGGTSYVLYLSNGILLQIWSRLLPVSPAWVPLITLFSVFGAAVGYVVWEEPLLRLLNHHKWEWPKLPLFLVHHRKAIQ